MKLDQNTKNDYRDGFTLAQEYLGNTVLVAVQGYKLPQV